MADDGRPPQDAGTAQQEVERRLLRQGGILLRGHSNAQRKMLAVALLVSGMVAAAIGSLAGGPQAAPVVAIVLALGMGLTFAMTRRAVQGLRADTVAELDAPERDRAVLEAAAANDGWVTPAMVVRQVRDMSLDEAKATLDRFLHAGHCSMDSNDEGQVFYHFAIGGKPGHQEVSPEQWVEQTARLLGPVGDTSSAGSEDVEA